ncbi:ATP-dependent RNA helicase HrpA [Corynebacterium sp. sy017]|uniref:ATP-dependent RNA helicase HrpA n=1 Tax=unclassified Corynebacterium TaxID=2624378 RepID=UPI0011860719|nr:MULTISPECIES: ATP-dependent RNA helicase HrpA [unclassified Corynebacterium]MBP3087771.1 ATP-dependent RNA helicase HrpA [Corynebacterium sp. sy017]TSD92320.1 ATP-dependent RNA helicase HrpA [Corynebacterium sp. SY003]
MSEHHHGNKHTAHTRCLYEKLSQVSIAEERTFRRRLAKARSAQALAAIEKDITEAQDRLEKRRLSIPTITYPETLPVTSRKDDIAAAIEQHQVVIIAGETGSGKTTQIPKICLELGRGIRGLIGHTQPRRLAARTVAERIAEELDQPVGNTVGYTIRFDDHAHHTTSVKLMTDGILLAEMQKDRYLNRYDTIIIDEAHERSLNIDFLLGYLKQLLPKRPDLKVIITSATIDVDRFAQHFCDSDGNPAPIIEVSGRTYPVDILYRPLTREDGDTTIDLDPLDGLIQAIEELMSYGPGDILCFFPSEADIRAAMEAIENQKWAHTEVTPLFGRLSNAEQHRVFSAHSGRRIVLATNIAETSLTVPGIRYVVDTGTARVSRYSVKNKVQRLPIEKISQASANQRSGRCGRVAEGIAIRLYSEQDFHARPRFSDPEILRTNLANVILRMASLHLGDIESFPFIEKPDTRSIRDGLLLLHELGALAHSTNSRTATENISLSAVGKKLARIPLDPRMGRILIEGEKLGCLHDIYIIVAALSIQDVRERPLDYQAQADQAHARFNDKTSDFLGYLSLWNYLDSQRAKLSGNAFRRLTQQEYLHYMRIREWWDLVAQLKNIGDQLGWEQPEADNHVPDADSIHQALLSGFLSQIGIRLNQSKEFQGTRNTRFMIFPGSALAKKPPQFLMAAELVETTKLWARNSAGIDPAWVEKYAKDVLKHQYSEPHWSAKRASAMVYQNSTLYGVPIISNRLTSYHVVDKKEARELFIRHALVEGDWNTHHKFFHANMQKLQSASEIEEKTRRRDLVIDEDSLFDFYDQRISGEVYNGISFDRWWKRNRPKNPSLLDFDPDALLNSDAEHIPGADFPDTWQHNDLEFELEYRFEPGHEADGVTVYVPVPLLANLDPQDFQWLVPGLRAELLSELIRTLPKQIRRTLVPAPDFAAKISPLLSPRQGNFYSQIVTALEKIGRGGIREDDFSPHALPAYLRMRFAAVDRSGAVIDASRDLVELQNRQADKIKSSVAKTIDMPHSTATQWSKETLGDIPEKAISVVDGQKVTTYPALVVTNEGITIKAMPSQQAAHSAMLTATLTLLMRKISISAQKMINGLTLQQKVAVENYPHGGVSALMSDAKVTAIRDLILENGGPSRSVERYEQLADIVTRQAPGRIRQFIVTLAPGLVDYFSIKNQLEKHTGQAAEDMKKQLDFLLSPHALATHGINQLKHLPRYIQAISIRLHDAAHNSAKDRARQKIVNELEQSLEEKIHNMPHKPPAQSVHRIKWMLQELRVSLFAQKLGTATSVSEHKISKAIAALQ